MALIPIMIDHILQFKQPKLVCINFLINLCSFMQTANNNLTQITANTKTRETLLLQYPMYMIMNWATYTFSHTITLANLEKRRDKVHWSIVWTGKIILDTVVIIPAKGIRTFKDILHLKNISVFFGLLFSCPPLLGQRIQMNSQTLKTFAFIFFFNSF